MVLAPRHALLVALKETIALGRSRGLEVLGESWAGLHGQNARYSVGRNSWCSQLAKPVDPVRPIEVRPSGRSKDTPVNLWQLRESARGCNVTLELHGVQRGRSMSRNGRRITA